MPHHPLSEKLLFCCGVGIFALAAVCILSLAYAELTRVWRRRRHLIRLPGTVFTVIKERQFRAGGGNQPSRYTMRYFPVIGFTTPEGKRIEFRSELGESHTLRRKITGAEIPPPPPSWRDGDSIEVFYDPSGEMKPCIAVAWSLWLTGVGCLVAGTLFLVCTILMAFFGGPKLFGWT